MREDGPTIPSSFTLSLSSDDDYNKVFQLPQMIDKIDMFSPLSPIKQNFKFLRARSKLLTGFQEGYRSPPVITYGGMSEWLYLITGKIELRLHRPTKVNLLRQLSWDPTMPCKWSASVIKHTLEPGHFVNIPAGWISERIAKSGSFMLSGEYLHHKDFATQLEKFDTDVLQSAGKYALDRDAEIRYAYWIFAAYMLETPEGRHILNDLDKNNLDHLKNHFFEWKKKHKSSIPAPHSVYLPPGIRCGQIGRDLTNYVCVRQKRQRTNKSP